MRRCHTCGRRCRGYKFCARCRGDQVRARKRAWAAAHPSRGRQLEPAAERPAMTFPAGRTCRSCGARLNSYNPGPDCHPCRQRRLT